MLDKLALASDWYRHNASDDDARVLCADRPDGWFIIRNDINNPDIMHLNFR